MNSAPYGKVHMLIIFIHWKSSRYCQYLNTHVQTSHSLRIFSPYEFKPHQSNTLFDALSSGRARPHQQQPDLSHLFQTTAQTTDPPLTHVLASRLKIQTNNTGIKPSCSKYKVNTAQSYLWCEERWRQTQRKTSCCCFFWMKDVWRPQEKNFLESWYFLDSDMPTQA